MCETKFTKGPWLPPKGRVTKFIDARIGRGTLQEVCAVGPTQECSQQEANAYLIAAAPEMYDMLHSIENDANQIPPFLWGKIQVVLAKARGEHV